MIRETVFLNGRPIAAWGVGSADPASPRKHISPLLTFPAGGAAVGGLIGYAVKRDAHGAAVGAVVGAAVPFALAAAVIATGWSP